MSTGHVALTDILGFRNLIARGNPVEFERLRDDLTALVPALAFEENVRVRTFTDNTVVTCEDQVPWGRTSQMLVASGRYQFDMSLRGHFVRGGVSWGDLYADDFIVFGHALLDAYYAESELSSDPRIVLHSRTRDAAELVEVLQSGGTCIPGSSATVDELVLGDDGRMFVNYLSVAWDQRMDPRRALASHRGILGQKLERSAGRVLEKYEWVARYHNWFCATVSEVSDLAVPGVEAADFSLIGDRY